MIEVGDRDSEFILGIFESLEVAKETALNYEANYHQTLPFVIYEAELNTNISNSNEYWPIVFRGDTKKW